MNRKRKIIIGAAIVGALGVAGSTVAFAGGETETPITGTALEKASAAALAHTGGGTVTETESGDEESLYEVEVTKPDGTQVDVQLDESFTVVGSESDGKDDKAGEQTGSR